MSQKLKPLKILGLYSFNSKEKFGQNMISQKNSMQSKYLSFRTKFFMLLMILYDSKLVEDKMRQGWNIIEMHLKRSRVSNVS